MGRFNFDAHRIIFHNKFWMRYYKEPSLYDQRMKRLSCKIFSDYYEKPMPENLAKSSDQDLKCRFLEKDAYRRNLIKRLSMKQLDIDDRYNENYYTNNPQLRELTSKLRNYGLFRDEHLDFNDEMKRIEVLRGRVKVWKIKPRKNQSTSTESEK